MLTDFEIAVAMLALGNASASFTGVACYALGAWRFLIWLGWL